MSDLNKVILLGRLTRDPELRFTQSGTAVCDFDMAINRRSRTPDGDNREEVTFVTCTVWARRAEAVSKHLKKGSQALVEGRITQDRWETPEGKKRSKLKVTAESVIFLGSGRGGNSGSEERSEAAGSRRPSGAEDAPF